MTSKTPIPYRQIRAHYDEETITVYQAYSPAIALAAVKAQKLNASPDFSLNRMTWIKPSWCWMMYRSCYARKDERQTHILALKMTHAAFLELLGKASVTSGTRLTEEESKRNVRVQWDPERSPRIGALQHRSIQIGIGRRESESWVENGIVSIEDVTAMARKLEARMKEEWNGDVNALIEEGCMPMEKVYEVPEELRKILKMDEQE